MRRALAILMVVSFARSSLALGQAPPSPLSAGVDGGMSPSSQTTSIALPPAGDQPSPVPPLVPSTAQAQEKPRSPLSEVPIVTWVCGGLAAALFGVALGFGVSAADIDHRAGVNLGPQGVDLGLTRKTALAGQTDATAANGLFIGAGVVALVGLAFAAFSPEPAARWQAASSGTSP